MGVSKGLLYDGFFSSPSSGRHILYYNAKFNISSTRDKIAIIKMLHFICQAYEAI